MSPVLVSLVLLAGAPITTTDARPPSETPPAVADLTRFLPQEDLERDGRRTLGQLPRNLGRSVTAVFSRESVAPFLVGTVTASVAGFADMGTRSRLLGHAPGLSNAASTAGGASFMLPATIGLF